MQPPMRTSREKAELKHGTSSSFAPGSAQTSPSTGTLLQYSKCPISSENATLYECAAHGTRVCSLDVEYIGWNPYGVWVQVEALGSKFTCANPLSALAVIEPTECVVRSWMTVTRPASESWMSTTSLSFAFMNRSDELCGVNVSSVAPSGLGGAWGVPDSVMKAKLTGSIPTVPRQLAL